MCSSDLTRTSRRADEFELAKALIGGDDSAWLDKLSVEGEAAGLVAKAWTAVRDGVPEHALALLEETEQRVRSNTGHAWRARQVALLVAAFARAGDPDSGTALVGRIGLDSLASWRTWVWRSLVLVKVDGWCGTTFDGVCFLATVARGVALAGDRDLAALILRQAEDLMVDRSHNRGHLTTWDHSDGWIRALNALGAAADEVGGWKRTLELVNHCAHILLSYSLSPRQRRRATSAVARLAVDLGHAQHPLVVHNSGPADQDTTQIETPPPVGVLRSEDWHWAVPAVVEAVPEAFEVLVAELSIAARVSPLAD